MVPKNIIAVLGKWLGLFEIFCLFTKEEGADYMSGCGRENKNSRSNIC